MDLRTTSSRSYIAGLGFPTCVSVNNCVAHYSPLASDSLAEQTLAKGDVVKLHVGAHIDGFAAVSAETVVVGASADEPVTGKKADVIKAAWTAAEVAMRLVRVGNKNWAVTEAVDRVATTWGCKPVEGAFREACRCIINEFRCRYALVPSEPECHRRKETYYPQSCA